MTLQTYTNQNALQLKNFNFQMPSPTEMQNLIQFCQVMADTPFYKKLGAGGVLAVYLTAQERNLPFMSCLNGGLHSIEGRIVYSGGMVGSLIFNSGHTYKILSHNENECEILFTRGDNRTEPLKYKYTITDAQIAGYLTKDNWKKSPKAMLYNRALTGGAKMIFPEIMMGVLVVGELVGTNADGNLEVADNAIGVEDKSKNESCETLKPEPIIVQDNQVEDFKITRGIGSDSDYDKYLKAISVRCNKSQEDLIRSALTNLQGFEIAFEKWIASQKMQELPV